MARAKGPLFSQEASKQLGKTLIFKTKGGKGFVTRYNKPGGQNPFTPSVSQVNKRDLYGEAVEVWQDKTDSQKAYWNDIVKLKNLKMSGWNLFLRNVFEDPEGYLGESYHGIRIYGWFAYGKIELV